MTKKIALTERDIEIFKSLWKWKISSTTILYKKFFFTSSMLRAYSRLKELEESGYLECKNLFNDKFVWLLTSKSFKIIKEVLPQLQNEGYKSEAPLHDFLTSAFHEGAFLNSNLQHLILLSEQELRRLNPEHYPTGIPQSLLHRPDGYWYFNRDNKKLIALEVELNHKSKADYELIFDFYEMQTQVDYVLWLIPSHYFANTLIKHFRHTSKHRFVSFKDFKEFGYEAKFLKSELDQTLSSFLTQNLGETKAELVLPSQILNLRKSPHRSNTLALLDLK